MTVRFHPEASEKLEGGGRLGVGELTEPRPLKSPLYGTNCLILLD